jgi:hypothetical protein
MELCRDCPHVLHLFSAAADSSSYHMLMEVAGNGCLRDLLWVGAPVSVVQLFVCNMHVGWDLGRCHYQ